MVPALLPKIEISIQKINQSLAIVCVCAAVRWVGWNHWNFLRSQAECDGLLSVRFMEEGILCTLAAKQWCLKEVARTARKGSPQ